MSSSFAPSMVGTISDLDGYSIHGDYSFPSTQSHRFVAAPTDDFGFDPVPMGRDYHIKTEQMYSPPDEDTNFADFSFDPVKDEQSRSPVRALELDRMIAQGIPSSSATLSRFGQVTPPRSNSESSVEKTIEQKKTRQGRATKASIKEEPSQHSPISRKRRNTRKSSIATLDNPEEDEKRKQSLEKNRLAAAKCRVNKKEKTEQLQRDSHDKAVHNAFLRDQIMRMKEEVQQMNALLLAHANCEGCKSPEDIQKHLSNLGNEFFSQHLQGMSQDYNSFTNMPFDQSDAEHDHYYSPSTDHTMGNPPLPEFNREPEFDVSTPMHTD